MNKIHLNTNNYKNVRIEIYQEAIGSNLCLTYELRNAKGEIIEHYISGFTNMNYRRDHQDILIRDAREVIDSLIKTEDPGI